MLGPYVRRTTPEKKHYTACDPENTTTYMLHVVPITTHTRVRLKAIEKTKRKQKTEKERKSKNESEKGKERRKKKTRKEDEARKGKEKKTPY